MGLKFGALVLCFLTLQSFECVNVSLQSFECVVWDNPQVFEETVCGYTPEEIEEENMHEQINNGTGVPAWPYLLYNDYQAGRIYSMKACRQSCLDDSNCQAVTYSSAIRYCRLYNNVFCKSINPTGHPETVSWFKDPLLALNRSIVNITDPEERSITWGLRYLNHTSQTKAGCAEECKDKCKADQTCKTMSFSAKDGNCYFYEANRTSEEITRELWGSWTGKEVATENVDD